MQHQPTTITNARVVHGMTNAEYHAQSSISKSGLDLIRRAPSLFRHRRETPQEPTQAMRMGTLVHTTILEPDRMDDQIIIAPAVDRRTTAGKAEWAEFQIAARGREIVTQDELDKLDGIRDAVWAHPAARDALAMLSEVETSIFWTDELSGVDCRCRPDGIMENGVIIDVKTTKDARPDEFAKSIANYRYHVQAAFYSDGYQQAFGTPPKGFVFVAVETEPPYLTGVYVASEAMILRGRVDYRTDLETYRRCTESDTWQGLSPDPLVIDLPKWA